MISTFAQKYRVQKNAVEESYERQLGLRADERYDENANSKVLAILNYFHKCYNDVSIEVPKKRKKSPKSIYEKCKNKELERLSKLYVIEGISDEEIKDLYDLIEIRIHERKELNDAAILKGVKKLLVEEIENLNIENFLKMTMVPEISKSTKRTILIILRGKIEKSNLENKEELIKLLEDRYGKGAEEKTGNAENNIMKFESVEEISKDPERIALLHDKMSYLKSEDLMGMKIVITNIPSDIETENEELKRLIQLRDKEKDEYLKREYNNMAMQEIARDFIERISQDTEFLKEISAEVIPFSKKHKKKENGYEAYHIKIRDIQNPEYTLEIQSKSEYVENLARGNGEASHENRPGKKRIVPSTINGKKQFIKNLYQVVPEYTVFPQGENGYEIKKCSLLENVIGYYENILYPGTKDYDNVVKLIISEETQK